jgi:uncharacterized membrane protein HdeD (DUF308 family)
MIKFFEYLRLILVVAGIYLAFSFPQQAAFYLLCGLVLPLNGLLAIQVFACPRASENYLQRQSSVYTRYQSGAFFSAVFLVGLGALVFQASVAVQLTLVVLTITGFLFSGIVHLMQYVKEDQAPRVHLWRFIGSVAMAAVALCAIWRQLV